MLATQMKYEFNLKYNAIAGLHAPAYNDKEISTLLTWAQEKILKSIISPRPTPGVKSIEEDTLSRDKFSAWITNGKLTTSYTNDDNLPNGYFFNLPVDFLFPLLERANITFIKDHDCYKTGDLKNNIKVKPVTYDYYNDNINNPHKNPYDELVWRYVISQSSDERSVKRYELISDGNYIVNTYLLRYVKKPKPIIVSASVSIDGYTGVQECELDSFYHRDIIAMAVDDAIEIMKDPTRFQTFKIQNNL